MEEKEEVLDVSFEEPNKEKKSSLVGVLLTIVLIIGLMVGAYYLLNKTNDKEDGEDTVDEVTASKWNGIYKKEGSNNQVLLFSKDNKTATLKFAQEITTEGKKELFYSIQFEDGMVIEGGKMLRRDEEDTIFTVEKDEEKITITYSGEVVLADGYKEFVGTYVWVRDVTSTSLEEFKK